MYIYITLNYWSFFINLVPTIFFKKNCTLKPTCFLLQTKMAFPTSFVTTFGQRMTPNNYAGTKFLNIDT